MNKSLRKFIYAIILLFLIPGKILTGSATGSAEEIPLSSFKVSSFALHPGDPALEIPFDVDVNRPFLVDIVSPSGAFTVTLTTPRGEKINPANVISFNGEYVENEKPILWMHLKRGG